MSAAPTKMRVKEVWLRFWTKPPRDTTLMKRDHNDSAIEVRHREEARARGIDPDRLNRGKPDSGALVKDVNDVSLQRMVTSLRVQGFRMIDAFWNETRRQGGGMKWVVTFIFTGGGNTIQLSDVDRRWFERRTTYIHGKVTVYANPKRVPGEEDFSWRLDTVNCRLLKPEETPARWIRMIHQGDYSLDVER